MMTTLESAFAVLVPNAFVVAGFAARLRGQMATPPRAYHNEHHVRAVLTCLYAWTDSDPSAALVAAALYHDAIYDATQKDNEARSAQFCQSELAAMGVADSVAKTAAELIGKTAHHTPDLAKPDEVLLLDADLYILGTPPQEYAAYVQAVRTEYAHVPDDAWRTGRANVLQSFLQRPRIYHGDWAGRAEHEAQARINIATEMQKLAFPV